MPYFVKGILFYLFTLFLLRVGGKRTISNLTPGEVVVMIALGSLMVHPLKSSNVWVTMYGGSILIAGILIVSFAELRIPFLKKVIEGEPVVVIDEGKILHKNLGKVKMTQDELFMQLRLHKISYIEEVKTATFEVSGNLGLELYHNPTNELYELKEEVRRLSLLMENSVDDREEENTNSSPPVSIFDQLKK
ncbi:DUF421 domain-containing protein [Halobacillus rhizosphaerae]|uniref:DUF421 domain-containing protein n=1 Tax=Halobacillus rhizosphaerae TaxID=3064889 RepID=UPI00398B5870